MDTTPSSDSAPRFLLEELEGGGCYAKRESFTSEKATSTPGGVTESACNDRSFDRLNSREMMLPPAAAATSKERPSVSSTTTSPSKNHVAMTDEGRPSPSSAGCGTGALPLRPSENKGKNSEDGGGMANDSIPRKKEKSQTDQEERNSGHKIHDDVVVAREGEGGGVHTTSTAEATTTTTTNTASVSSSQLAKQEETLRSRAASSSVKCSILTEQQQQQALAEGVTTTGVSLAKSTTTATSEGGAQIDDSPIMIAMCTPILQTMHPNRDAVDALEQEERLPHPTIPLCDIVRGGATGEVFSKSDEDGVFSGEEELEYIEEEVPQVVIRTKPLVRSVGETNPLNEVEITSPGETKLSAAGALHKDPNEDVTTMPAKEASSLSLSNHDEAHHQQQQPGPEEEKKKEEETAATSTAETGGIVPGLYRSLHQGTSGSMEENSEDPESNLSPLRRSMCQPLHKTPVLESRRLKKQKKSDGTKRINNYFLLEEIGRGAYSKVKLCCHRNDRTFYACKILNRTRLLHCGVGSNTGLQKLSTEIAVLKKLRHDHIIALQEVINDPKANKIYLIFELAINGELMRILDDGTVEPDDVGCNRIPHWEAKRITIALLSAVQHAHDNGIAHRDIKPQNILLTEDNDVKLSDFGVATMIEGNTAHNCTSHSMSAEGTIPFLAPEILRTMASQDDSDADGGGNETSSGANSDCAVYAAKEKEQPAAARPATWKTTTTMTNAPSSIIQQKAGRGPLGGSGLRRKNTSNSGSSNKRTDLFKADIWSIGVTVFVMIFGEVPWKAHCASALLQSIRSTSPFHSPHIQSILQKEGIPEDVVDFISAALEQDPRRRPTCVDLAHHQWLRDISHPTQIVPKIPSVVQVDEVDVKGAVVHGRLGRNATAPENLPALPGRFLVRRVPNYSRLHFDMAVRRVCQDDTALTELPFYSERTSSLHWNLSPDEQSMLNTSQRSGLGRRGVVGGNNSFTRTPSLGHGVTPQNAAAAGRVSPTSFYSKKSVSPECPQTPPMALSHQSVATAPFSESVSASTSQFASPATPQAPRFVADPTSLNRGYGFNSTQPVAVGTSAEPFSSGTSCEQPQESLCERATPRQQQQQQALQNFPPFLRLARSNSQPIVTVVSLSGDEEDRAKRYATYDNLVRNEFEDGEEDDDEETPQQDETKKEIEATLAATLPPKKTQRERAPPPPLQVTVVKKAPIPPSALGYQNDDGDDEREEDFEHHQKPIDTPVLESPQPNNTAFRASRCGSTSLNFGREVDCHSEDEGIPAAAAAARTREEGTSIHATTDSDNQIMQARCSAGSKDDDPTSSCLTTATSATMKGDTPNNNGGGVVVGACPSSGVGAPPYNASFAGNSFRLPSPFLGASNSSFSNWEYHHHDQHHSTHHHHSVLVARSNAASIQHFIAALNNFDCTNPHISAPPPPSPPGGSTTTTNAAAAAAAAGIPVVANNAGIFDHSNPQHQHSHPYGAVDGGVANNSFSYYTGIPPVYPQHQPPVWVEAVLPQHHSTVAPQPPPPQPGCGSNTTRSYGNEKE